MSDKKRRKLKKPLTAEEAIKQTIVLHQAVIDGEFENYIIAKRWLNKGDCPLCCYNDFRHETNTATTNVCRETCIYCPWVKIQGVWCDQTVVEVGNALNFKDSVQSIKRLNSWLKGKPYKKRK